MKFELKMNILLLLVHCVSYLTMLMSVEDMGDFGVNLNKLLAKLPIIEYYRNI